MTNISNVGQIGTNSADVFSTGGNTSSPANVEISFKKKLTEEEIIAKYELKEQDLVELKSKYPDLLSKSEAEISEIVAAYKASNTQNTETPRKSDSTLAKNKTYKETTGKNYDFKSYKEITDPKQKVEILLEEYAKNIYQSKWDTMSDAEKTAAKKEVLANLIAKYKATGTDLDYDALIEMMQDPEKYKNISQDPKKMKQVNNLLESIMADIQTANQNNLTIDKYYAQDKETKNSQKYQLLLGFIEKDPNAYKYFSFSDKAFYDNENAAISAAKIILGDSDISSDNISRKINEYNNNHPDAKISRASLIYDYYDKKVKENGIESLDENERQVYNSHVKLKEYFEDLSKIPDFDSSNSTFLEMMKSNVYQTALHNALESGKSEEEAEQIAELKYLKSILGGNLSAEEFDNRYSALLEHCSITGATRLLKDVSSLKENGDIKISNNIAGNVRAIAAVATGVEDVNVDVDDFINSDNPEIKQNESFWLSGIDRMAMRRGDTETSKKIRRHGLAPEYITANRHYANDNNIDIREVENDVIKNSEKYNDQALLNITKAGFEGLENWTEEEQINRANSMGDIVTERHNADISKAYAQSGHTAKGKAQLVLANRAMGISYTFDDDIAKSIQKVLVGDISKYEVQNQTNAHEIVTSSKYSEVQEYAASNIHKLDSSVQSDAINITYSTGNETAIRACEAQLNQCSGVNPAENTYANYVENQNAIKNIQNIMDSLDLSKAEDVKKFVELVEKNSIEISKYLVSCSDKEKATFVEKYCNLASESQILAFVAKNPSMYELVLRYAKSISREKLFRTIYKGNAAELPKLLKKLGISNVVKLANNYKEIAVELALSGADGSSELARQIVTNPDAWGYQMGRPETQKLQQIASKKQISFVNNDTNPTTAYTLRDTVLPRDKRGILFA